MARSKRQKMTRILVVEDSTDDQELLMRQLRKADLADHIRFIGNGNEALKFLMGPDADDIATNLRAIFLDLNLGDMRGIDLLRKVREEEAYVDTPVIVMTSSNDPSDLQDCQRLNVAHYITKPVSLAAFAKAIADTFQPSLKASPLAFAFKE